jgi:hypothetical protein
MTSALQWKLPLMLNSFKAAFLLKLQLIATLDANGDTERTVPELNQKQNHCSLKSSATQSMLTLKLPHQFGKIASNQAPLLPALFQLVATGLKVKN